mgnify:CR=1 FL=1
MHVGVMRLVFHIPHARSLKDKRSVVRKFRDRIRARHDLSIAEVADQDSLLANPIRSVVVVRRTRRQLHQKATFGAPVVSADASVAHSVLEAVAHAAETQPDAILTHRSTEDVVIGDDANWDDHG